jgi:hypothetical protein
LEAFAGPDLPDIRGGGRGHVRDKIAALGLGFYGLLREEKKLGEASSTRQTSRRVGHDSGGLVLYLEAFAGPDPPDIRGGDCRCICDKIAALGMGFSGPQPKIPFPEGI